MSVMEKFEKRMIKKEVPTFSIGDTVVVSVKIKEEGKTRIQDFEGIVIGKKGSGIRSSFTVRRISYGEGVERTFPINSLSVDKVSVKKKGKTRRAKLYYLRKKHGKKGKVGEKIEKEKKEPEASVLRKEGT